MSDLVGGQETAGLLQDAPQLVQLPVLLQDLIVALGQLPLQRADLGLKHRVLRH